jgi:hypothetical protein
LEGKVKMERILTRNPPRDNELEDDKVGRRVGRKETESGLRELKTVW